MKSIVVTLLIVSACKSAAPAGDPCAAAAARVIALGQADPPPSLTGRDLAQANASIREMGEALAATCRAQAWSPAVTGCYRTIANLGELERCDATLTAAQRAERDRTLEDHYVKFSRKVAREDGAATPRVAAPSAPGTSPDAVLQQFYTAVAEGKVDAAWDHLAAEPQAALAASITALQGKPDAELKAAGVTRAELATLDARAMFAKGAMAARDRYAERARDLPTKLTVEQDDTRAKVTYPAGAATCTAELVKEAAVWKFVGDSCVDGG